MSVEVDVQSRVRCAWKRNGHHPRLVAFDPLAQLDHGTQVLEIHAVPDVEWLSSRVTSLNSTYREVSLTGEDFQHEGLAGIRQMFHTRRQCLQSLCDANLDPALQHTSPSHVQKVCYQWLRLQIRRRSRQKHTSLLRGRLLRQLLHETLELRVCKVILAEVATLGHQLTVDGMKLRRSSKLPHLKSHISKMEHAVPALEVGATRKARQLRA